MPLGHNTSGPAPDPATVAAHSQAITNRYTLAYPAHEARTGDPHYAAFAAYRRAHIDAAVCYVGKRVGFDQCADAQGKPMLVQPIAGGHGLELHHAVVEYAMLNEVDLAAIGIDHPEIKDAESLDAFAESADDLQILCSRHHRGRGGVHHAAAADWTAELYVRNLITP